MGKNILKIVAVVLIVFLIAAAMQPSEFKVTRTATINAPASAIFPHVNDQQQWMAWSPWAKMDPDAKFTFEGPKAGKGSIAIWKGNMQVGEGKSTITESVANKSVTFQLDFEKPMKGTSISTFIFAPATEGKGTLVSWSMEGHNNFMAKAIGLLMNCEKIVGEQFDNGLANLKGVVEKK